MNIRERLIREIEQAPEPVLEATLEAYEDALDVFSAKCRKPEREQPGNLKGDLEKPALYSKSQRREKSRKRYF
jgi:hypothetical protein